MIDEIKLKNQMQRGERAKSIIDDPIYQEAFDATKNELLKYIESTRFEEKEKREDIYRTIRALNHLREYMTQLMVTGKNAKKELANIKDPSHLRKFVGLP